MSIKAADDGCGLDIQLRDYSLKTLAPERLAVIEEATQRPLAWRVRTIPLRQGYACAVCTDSDWREIRVIDCAPDTE